MGLTVSWGRFELYLGVVLKGRLGLSEKSGLVGGASYTIGISMRKNIKIADISRPLFESLFNKLVGKASFDMSTIDGELRIEIDPFVHTAAKISAKIIDGEGIYLFLGLGSVFEVPLSGKRYTDKPCQNEAVAICEATINGNLREIVFTKAGKVIGAKSEILLEGKVISSTWRQFFTNPFRKKIESEFAYASY